MLGGTPSGPPSRTAKPEKVTARTALQGSKGVSKGGKNPLAPSSNQFENLPTAITDTEAPGRDLEARRPSGPPSAWRQVNSWLARRPRLSANHGNEVLLEPL